MVARFLCFLMTEAGFLGEVMESRRDRTNIYGAPKGAGRGQGLVPCRMPAFR